MAVRLKDIADHLGLSVSTVSAALQGRADISKATQKLVSSTVEEMGYQPNSVARSLITRKTNVLGVIIPDLSRSFFAEVLKGIDTVSSPAGYNLLLCNTEENPAKEDEMLRMLLSRQVDGIILASAHNASDSTSIQTLRSLSTPLVLVDRFLPSLNFVGGDDEMIGFQATSHLIRQGYKRVAHISGQLTISTAAGRRQGYLKALRRFQIPLYPDYIIESHYHEESGGEEAMTRLLRLGSPPDAIFAASDPIAIGALQAILEAGLLPGNDLGLIGVGNHRYGPYLRVPLSTMDQQRTLIGQEAAKLLLKLIGRTARSRMKNIAIEPKLIIRGSSGRRGKVASLDRSQILKDL
jgi:LacI family transcriptional regulator